MQLSRVFLKIYIEQTRSSTNLLCLTDGSNSHLDQADYFLALKQAAILATIPQSEIFCSEVAHLEKNFGLFLFSLADFNSIG